MRYILFLFVVVSCLFAKGLLAHGQSAPVSNDMGITTVGASSIDTAELTKRIEAIQAAAGNKTMTYMTWALLAAFVIKLLIDQIQSWTDLSDKAKKSIPLVCAILSALATIAGKFGAGMNIEHAIILGGVPLLSVMVNELHNAVKASPKSPSPPENKKPDIAPVAPAALVLVFVGFALSVASCGPNAQQNAVNYGTNFAACGLGKLPGVAGNIAPVVQDALQHDPAWQSALAGLGVAVGEDTVTCAVYAAVATWQQAQASHAALEPAALKGIENGKAWIAAHPQPHAAVHQAPRLVPFTGYPTEYVHE